MKLKRSLEKLMCPTVETNTLTVKRRKPRTVHGGFSLIELLVVVAIVALLAAIAFPTYTGYVTRSEIRTGQADLLSLSMALENRYQRTLSYPNLDSTNAGTTAKVRQVLTAWSPASEVFEFSAVSEGTGYTLTAAGSGPRLDGCSLTINDANVRASTSCPHTGGGWL